VLVNPGSNFNFAYAYVDDVSLEPCTATNLSKIKPGGDVEVFPNPFEDKIDIAWPGHNAYQVVVYNMLHECVLTASFTEKETLNTATLPKGIYFCEIRDQGRVITTKKAVKQ
jgi:hypothetical protein